MMKLSAELQHALDQHPSEPPRCVDPRTGRVYVLVAADVYVRIRGLLAPSDDIAETYPAQIDSAMRAGWDALQMSDYDRYDELCP
jgi:hypothetical protein